MDLNIFHRFQFTEILIITEAQNVPSLPIQTKSLQDGP